MALSDEDLLDFDADRLGHFDPDEAKAALDGENGDLYRNHLMIARWLDGWIERMAGEELEGQEQFDQALREVGAHLRQGDFVPGGAFLTDEDSPGA